MKRILSACCLLSMLSAQANINVDRVDPPHWWTGMHDRTLQLQVHGKGIRDARFTLDYPGVSVDSVVRLDGSPNWQHVYLTVTPEARPGTMTLEWRDEEGQTVSRRYELRQRRPQSGAQGFTSADVLYLVMPDRFADGNPDNNVIASMRHPESVNRRDPNLRHGGDFEGIRQHIDYLDSLGITAVWFNPVLENDMPGGSYHGYATTDYYAVDPRFGSNLEYASLVDTLHTHGIKTVMDMIFNHCGSAHPWMADRPSTDWFNFPDGYVQTNYRLSTLTDPYVSDRDKKLTLDGWFVELMPDLNQHNTHLWKYLIQNSIWWIEETGIDGIRQDTYAYIEPELMADWVDAVLAEYPNFNIVGECWYGDPAGVAYWQKGSPLAAAKGVDTHLPTIMDFPLMLKVRDMAPFRMRTDAWNGLATIYDHLALDYIYPEPKRVLRFLDNHDTERFIQTMPDSLAQWKQGVALLLTVPGIPQLYYGTELLMSGTREGGDGNIRKDIPGGFPGDTHSEFVSSGRSAMQNEAYGFISKINRWRKGSKAVAEGSMKHYFPDNGLYVFERRTPKELVVVVMNGTDATVSADMTRYEETASEGQLFTDILTGDTLELIPSGGTRTFAPREIRILESIAK